MAKVRASKNLVGKRGRSREKRGRSRENREIMFAEMHSPYSYRRDTQSHTGTEKQQWYLLLWKWG